jgi:pimeloyl-ACP methyl ester carboxylesterase
MTVPSVLVVPGAWHKPDHYRLLVDELSDIHVQTVTLTSSGDDPATLQDMHSDAEVIADAAAAIDGPVVVVAHSYGGVPTTQAFRQAGNVARIVYVASFQLLAGEALVSTNGGALMPWSRRRQQQGFGDYVEVISPMTAFYNDVDAVIARRAVDQLGFQSYASMTQPLTATAWQTIPSTYVICEADNAIPVATQEAMAGRADDAVRLPTSHSPFLSQPAALADVIRTSLESLNCNERRTGERCF